MKNKAPNQEMKIRLSVVILIIAGLFFYITYNYYQIQVVDNEYYSKKALASQTKAFVLPAKRGIIYDRNGEALAHSITKYRVYISKDIFDMSQKEKLLSSLELSEERFDSLFNNNINGFTLARHIDQEVKDLIEIEEMPGVWFEKDPSRIYPYNQFASRVIGHTNTDLEGITGIEYKMNTTLKGTDGVLRTKTDALGRPLPYGDEERVNPVNGANVYLTIDEVIQHFTEKSLAKGMEETGSKKMSAIVMDVKTGEILAMSTNPSYDLNDPRTKPMDMDQEAYDQLDINEKVTLWNQNWKNTGISEIYEPGSTFKIITAAIGLEENVVTPQTQFNETTGFIDVYDQKIRCWIYPGHHGKETFTEALENSCNPVFVKVAQEIGAEKFHRSLVGFGLNDDLEVQLPGVQNYPVRELEDIGPVQLATMGYGHGVSVTPLQLMRTLSGLINHGELVEPRIIKKVENENEVIQKDEVKVKRKIISKETSKTLRLMLESVVVNGSGKSASISGIRVGGKTGTSLKLVDGEYDEDKVMASFFAFAPVEDPEIAILVIADEPQSSSFGSVVAAPVVKEIMESTLRHIGVKPDFNDE